MEKQNSNPYKTRGIYSYKKYKDKNYYGITFLKPIRKYKNYYYWLMKCHCGNLFESIPFRIISKLISSCGCSQEARYENIVGKKFNQLTVIKKLKKRNRKKSIVFLCKCDCGALVKTTRYPLTNGLRKSCFSRKLFTNENKNRHIPIILRQQRRFFKMYKDSAKLRKLKFSLTFKQFLRFIKSKCYYCGIPELEYISFNYYKALDNPFKANGIDRVDNNIGYIKRNCVTCCKFCNTLKNKNHFSDLNIWLKWNRIKPMHQKKVEKKRR